MTGAARVLAVTTALAVVLAVYLFLANRDLEAQLAARPAAPVVAEAAPANAAGEGAGTGNGDGRGSGRTRDARLPLLGALPPSLPDDSDEPKETRGERRARRTEEIGNLLGRKPGETDDEYRARVGSMIKLGLAIPRERSTEARREAEAKAKVTPEQSKAIDEALAKSYDDVLAYTNKAIADGQLSPYERNVSGWLEFAGGLGTVLGDTEASIGKILQPDQVKALYDSGFEWAEYLGTTTPWENLNPPPPR